MLISRSLDFHNHNRTVPSSCADTSELPLGAKSRYSVRPAGGDRWATGTFSMPRSGMGRHPVDNAHLLSSRGYAVLYADTKLSGEQKRALTPASSRWSSATKAASANVTPTTVSSNTTASRAIRCSCRKSSGRRPEHRLATLRLRHGAVERRVCDRRVF